MALSDLFSNNAAQQAAGTTQLYTQLGLANATGLLNAGVSSANDYLQSGANAATSYLGTGASQASDYLNTGTNNAISYLSSGQAGAQDWLTGGYVNAAESLGSGASGANDYLSNAIRQILYGTGAANAYYTNASDVLNASKANYASLQPQAQSAYDLYAQLIGAAPSAAGSVQATLESQPGFQTSMDLALQAANRTAAAGGNLNSGNAIQSAMTTAQGLESANINDYAARLLAMAGYAPQIAGQETSIDAALSQIQQQQAALQMQSAQAIAGVSGQQAANQWNLGTAQATNASNLGTAGATNVWNFANPAAAMTYNTGTAQAANANQLGTNLASTATNLGTGQSANTMTGATNAAGLTSQAYNQVGNAYANADLASQQAAANVWNALMGGGQLAVKAFTGIPALGGSAPTTTVKF